MAKSYQKLKDEEVEKDDEDSLHPKQTASCLSLLFFSWCNGLIKTGNERPLEQSDLLPLLPEHKSEGLTVLLEEEWNKELRAAELEEDKKPRLWRALMRLSPWYHYVTILLLTSLRLICNLLQPVLLSLMLSALLEAPKSEKYMAYIYGLGICLSALVLVFAQVHYEFQASLVGMRIRTALVGLLYKTVLQLSRCELQRNGSGNLMNLVSNDVERFNMAVTHLPTILLAPLESALAMGLLCWLTGWPSSIGALMVVGFILFQLLLAEANARLRGKAASFTDKRVTLTREIISGIRAVKMYTWEGPYKESVLKARWKEANVLVKMNWINAAFVTLYAGVGRMVLAFAILMALLLSGYMLTPVIIFFVLTTTTALKLGVFGYLSHSVKKLGECKTSLLRIEANILKINKIYETNLHSLNQKVLSTENENRFENYIRESNPLAEANVRLHNVFCSYDDKTLVLSDVSFTACATELVLISGPVGSGKSSLLNAILGELPVIDGTINLKGTVAYVPQTSWVFSGTLRDNIVFHQPFEYSKYQAVIRACELEKDLKALSNGDMTFVGERGIVLSGGQRSRVSLARAVYADCDIYLFDDPLSAVDAKVGKRIFENAICGILRNRIRLLVTHHKQYQKHCDKTITLAGGRVASKELANEEKNNRIFSEKDNNIPYLDIRDSYDETSEKKSEEVSSLVMSKEDRSFGHVSWRTYVRYTHAAFPLLCSVLLHLFVVIALVSTVLPDWWISRWTTLSWTSSRDHTEIVVYVSLVGASTVLVFVEAFLVLQATLRSSTNFHNKMLDAVIKAPVFFFDTNPTGRILNRFTKDIGVMDELLPYRYPQTLPDVFSVVVGFTLPSLVNYWVAVFALPLLAVCFFYGRRFIRVSRETTRLQAINYSPVLSHFSDTLDGLAIIRTSKKKEEFTRMLYKYQDNLCQAWFTNLFIPRWLSVRTNMLCFVLLTFLVLCSFLTAKAPGLIGLSVMYAAQMLDSMDFVARSLADLENYMTSVERALVYTKTDSEPGYNIKKMPQENWPRNGSLNIDNVSQVYYDGGPLVLKDITFNVEHAEKIGIVGRTGAGKSSLVASLMRMPEPRGNIFIDGVDIKTLNLTASRQVISVIPQNPVLFSGTLRRNIDPFGVASDFDIFRVLEDVHLRDAIDGLEGQLDYCLTEGGSNFSVGERQLICLARALLQGNKIIIMDEATANVDYETDQLIQETIRDNFKECTVLTIAHRVKTVMDYDRIIVLHQGKLVETGRPSQLLEISDGVFAQLCVHAETI